jgi:hypothetical protein
MVVPKSPAGCVPRHGATLPTGEIDIAANGTDGLVSTLSTTVNVAGAITCYRASTSPRSRRRPAVER